MEAPPKQQRDGIWKQCPHGRNATCKESHGSYSWRVRAGRDPRTGKPRYLGGTGLPSRKEAKKARDKALGQIVDGKVASDRGFTFGAWLDHCFEEMVSRPDPPERKTIDMHRTNISIWKAESGLADVRLGRLTKPDFNDAFLHLGRVRTDAERPAIGRYGRWVAQRSHSTLLRYKATATWAMTAAVEDGLIPVSPVAGRLRALKRKDSAVSDQWEDVDAWTLQQNRTFLDGIAGDPDEELWITYMFTGARRGELLGAETRMLDELKTRLKIKTTAIPGTGLHDCCICPHQHERVEIKPAPKGKRSRRRVSVPKFVQAALDRQEAKVDAMRLAYGPGYAEHGLIFPAPNGVAKDGDKVTDRFQDICEELGLPIVGGLHFLRHNAVSLLLSIGMPLEQVAMNTGHDPEMIRRVYGHLLEDINAAYYERAVEVVMGGWQQVGSKSIKAESVTGLAYLESRRSEAV